MKKYTKKQIREAITYWEMKLDESGFSSGTELAELAKKMSPDLVKFADMVGAGRLDEVSLSNISAAVGAAALAACMFAKILGGTDGAKVELEAAAGEAGDARLAEISESLDRMQKDLNKMQRGLDGWFAEKAAQAEKDDAAQAKARQALFDKIMAEN